LREEDAERILALEQPAATPATIRAASSDQSNRLEEYRSRTRAEVQRSLERHMADDQRHADYEFKKEQAERRLAEGRKEKAAEERAAKEEKLKQKQTREQRASEALGNARKNQRETARELAKKLSDTFEKVELHLKSRHGYVDKVREERHHRLEGVVERREQATLKTQQEAIRRYLDREQKSLRYIEALDQVKRLQKDDPEKKQQWAEFCEAHGGGKKDPMRFDLEMLQTFLQDQRDKPKSRAASEDGRCTDKLEVVQARFEKRQAEKEAAFRQTAEHLVRAEAAVREKKEERAQKAREGIEKRFAKKDQNLEGVRKERYERRKGVLDKIAAKDAKTSPREKLIKEENRRRTEQRELMEEVVASNLQRLERAQEFAREQLLAKIQQGVAKGERLVEQRQQLQQQRVMLTKEALIEKSNALESLRTMKATPRSEVAPPTADSSK